MSDRIFQLFSRVSKGLGGRGGYREEVQVTSQGLRIILVVGKYEMGSSTSKRIEENADVVEEILPSTPQGRKRQH